MPLRSLLFGPDGGGLVTFLADDLVLRMAKLGDAGFIQFTVDESARLVRVYDLVRIG